MQLWQLASEHARRPGFEVVAVLLNDGELALRLREAGVDVHILDEARLGPVALTRRLAGLLRTRDPQIIHTHRVKENLLGLAANLCSLRAPVVRTVHGMTEHPVTWRNPLRKSVAQANLLAGRHLTRAVIAVSEDLARHLRLSEGYRNVVVIRNGIDAAMVRRAQKAAPFVDPQDRTIHVGLLGRLEPVKRVDIFLQLAALLDSAQPAASLRFHVLGDGSLRTALEARAAGLGLAGKVVFHGHQAEAMQWLACLDVLVLCSDHEGMPMVLLEAMAAGIPVVAHAVGGITSAMRDGVGGVLVDRQDAHAYAEAVSRVLEDWSPEKSAASLARVETEYSAAGTAAATARLYEDCLGARSQSRS